MRTFTGKGLLGLWLLLLPVLFTGCKTRSFVQRVPEYYLDKTVQRKFIFRKELLPVYKFSDKHNRYNMILDQKAYRDNTVAGNTYLSENFVMNRHRTGLPNIQYLTLFFNFHGLPYPLHYTDVNNKNVLNKMRNGEDIQSYTNAYTVQKTLDEITERINALADGKTKIIFHIHGHNVPGKLAWYFGDEIGTTLHELDKKEKYLIVRVIWDSGAFKNLRQPEKNGLRAGFLHGKKTSTSYQVGKSLRYVVKGIKSEVPVIYFMTHSLGGNVATQVTIDQVSKTGNKDLANYVAANYIAKLYLNVSEKPKDVLPNDKSIQENSFEKEEEKEKDNVIGTYEIPGAPTPKRKINTFLIAASMPGWNTFIDLKPTDTTYIYLVGYNRWDDMLLKQRIWDNKMVTKFGSTTLGCDYMGEATYKTPIVFNKLGLADQYYTTDLSINNNHYFTEYLRTKQYKNSLKWFLNIR